MTLLVYSKNNVLIDIIGVFGNSFDFAKNVTLRRKSGVSNPNTTYDAANGWDTYPKDTVDDIGTHTTSLSTTNMHLGYPYTPIPAHSITSL